MIDHKGIEFRQHLHLSLRYHVHLLKMVFSYLYTHVYIYLYTYVYTHLNRHPHLGDDDRPRGARLWVWIPNDRPLVGAQRQLHYRRQHGGISYG